MPWLVREEEAESVGDALLFVHVPRCGGARYLIRIDFLAFAPRLRLHLPVFTSFSTACLVF